MQPLLMRFLLLLGLSLCLLTARAEPLRATPVPPPAPLAAALASLLGDDPDARSQAVLDLALSPDVRARTVLQALREDGLFVFNTQALLLTGEQWVSAQSGQVVPVPADAAAPPEQVTVNNRLRGDVVKALALGDLRSPDVAVRRAAATELSSEPPIPFAARMALAAQAESDAETAQILRRAAAQALLASPDAGVRLQALATLAGSGEPSIAALIRPLTTSAEPDAAVREAARHALTDIQQRLFWGDLLDRLFTGLSLGSILLLAALGLAITYGVMGVINMAHGEFLMIGAYGAYAMQGLFQQHAPGLQAWYLAAALPVGFLAAALTGVVLERLVVRHLYGRPLETLLATWGLSLILIQAARALFGPQNVSVANPFWMSGSLILTPSLVLPWNRLLIIAFAVAVLALTWGLMQRTRLGLYVRAVTQNRPMAACVGVATQRIDTLAFALGAGIAGLGGVALSQISNVGPEMGQGYIVDSFMVVVLGGVGQLAGAVLAALGLGVATKLLEGWTGAVIAKILVLVFVIVFIQKRPQGLFAQRGRHADA